MNYHILNEAGEVVSEPDFAKWGEFQRSGRKRIALTEIAGGRVSTVFLGVDHGWGPGPPLWFETMCFEIPGFGDYQERYETKSQALAGHAHIVATIEAALTAHSPPGESR